MQPMSHKAIAKGPLLAFLMGGEAFLEVANKVKWPFSSMA